MDDRQTNEMDNSLNNEPVNVPEEDLTSIFNTPIDENTTNLGVGETSSNYANKVSEDTEILDLNEINAFKEAEINVEPLEVSNSTEPIVEPTVNSVESTVVDNLEANPFEMNSEVSVPVQEENNIVVEPLVNNNLEDATIQMPAINSEESVAIETVNNDSLQVPITDTIINSQPNVMNGVNNLNPIGLETVTNEGVNNDNTSNSSTGNQEFLNNQDESLMPPTLDSSLENNNVEIPKEKKKNKFILPIIIVIAVLGLLVALYFLLFNNPKKVFDKTISSGFDALYESLDMATKYDTMSGSGSLSYKLSATDASMQSVFDMINGIAFDYKYAVDYKNKLMNVDFNSTYNNEKLIDLSVYGENGKGYVFLKDVYNKYLSTDIEGYEDIFETTKNQEEVKVILTSVEKALSKSLTNDDFVKEEVTIKVNGKDEKVTSNALVLTNENFNRICKSMLTTLKDDADFISAVNKISQDENVDTKDALEDVIANIGEVDTTDKSTVKLSIYTKGILKQFVGINFEVNDENTIAVSMIKTNDDTYSIVGKQDNKEVVTGTLKVNATDSTSDVEIIVNVPDVVNVQVNVKSTVNYNSTFNKVDVTNSVDANTLTDVEANTIMTNLMTNPGLSKLITNIQALMGSMNPTTDEYNASYDFSADYSSDYTIDNTYYNYGV